MFFFYRFTSIVTVFVNKSLLSSDTVKLDAPLFVTWVQCITSVVICLSLRLIKRSYLPNPDAFSSNTIKTVTSLIKSRFIHLKKKPNEYISDITFSRFIYCINSNEQFMFKICWCFILLYWTIIDHSV